MICVPTILEDVHFRGTLHADTTKKEKSLGRANRLYLPVFRATQGDEIEARGRLGT